MIIVNNMEHFKINKIMLKTKKKLNLACHHIKKMQCICNTWWAHSAFILFSSQTFSFIKKKHQKRGEYLAYILID